MNVKAETDSLFELIMETKTHGEPLSFFDLDFSEHTEEEELELMIKLYKEDWHYYHDNLTHIFQQRREPKMVPHLVEVAKKTELETSTKGTIARVCCYALSYIGTDAAKAGLKELGNCKDNDVRRWAKQHLESWENLHSQRGQRIQGTIGKRILTETMSDFIDRVRFRNNLLNLLTDDDSIVLFTLIDEGERVSFDIETKKIIIPDRLIVYSSYKKILELGSYEKLGKKKIFAIWLDQNYLINISSTRKAIFPSYRPTVKRKSFKIIGKDQIEIGYLEVQLVSSLFYRFKKRIKYIHDLSRFYNKQINYIKRKQTLKLRMPLEQLQGDTDHNRGS